jgi:tetratricopeptide (TPR) repeat protein
MRSGGVDVKLTPRWRGFLRRTTPDRMFSILIMSNSHMNIRFCCLLVLGGAGLFSRVAWGAEPPSRDAADRDYADGSYSAAAKKFAAWLAVHPEDGDARNRLGWCRYRTGGFAAAKAIFDEQLRRHAADADARVGRGFSRLQTEDVAGALADFRQVLVIRPADPDARRGLALAALRSGEETRLRNDADASRPVSVPARALSDYLEVRDEAGAYSPLFVKGVNLGAALPGKYPTEFPRDVATYAGWLDTIAGLGANAVRLYTLLPPEFYAALAAHNAAPSARKLWLIQGVWAELPDDGDFSGTSYVEEFDAEIARAIDAIHGDLVLPERPGHAGGLYDTDASDALLALIIGREWEPWAVQAFDARYPDRTAFSGTYLRVQSGHAMETWVARMCDFAAAYEARRHRMLHPLTFANWPTLDPLRHATESNRDEEDAWRAKYGIPFPEALREPPWENDAVSLDATAIGPTEAMPAGFFAAYHVYPNYPDFVNLEPSYAEGRDAVGPSRYAAYLQELKRYHGRQPVLVAEFGISTSRGVAHVQPEGWNHGGIDERRQGELVARMLGSIHDAKYAGGIVFEFMDEWFKGTWSAAPLEIPADRRRLWFDAESPEQSYGLIANRPRTPVRVDGDPSEWTGRPYLSSGAQRGGGGWERIDETRLDSDEGYLYLLLRTEGGPEPPDLGGRVAYRVAIDTYDASRGETRLPEPGAATIATGAEFLIDLAGPERSFVTVTAPYEPHAAIESGPVASPAGGAGAFAHLLFEANRERIARDGTRTPRVVVDRGALRFGSLDPGSSAFDSRTDVAIGAATGTIEMRIPWAILNVTDPSSRRVLHQVAKHEPPLDTKTTDGFRVYAFAVDPSDPGRPPLSRLPAAGAKAPLYAWKTWDVPGSRTEPKQGTARIREAMNAIRDRIETATIGGHDAH